MSTYLNEEGQFECVVEKPRNGWFGESAEKKTPFICLVLSVADNSNRTIPWYGWLSEKAFDKTIARLAEVFGFDGDLAGLFEGQQTLEGRPCKITTQFEDYKGKQKCRVKWLNSTQGKASPMPKSKTKSLVESLTPRAKTVAAGVQSAQSAPEAAPVQDTEAAEGDDVPF